MILRPLNAPAEPASENDEARPAWKVFMEREKHVAPPFGIIFQPEHSILAGHLAQSLLPGVFGELPPEVMQAISQHDFGWRKNDEANKTNPRPFPDLSTDETLPSWYESIAQAKSIGPLGEVMVSRHFTTLGTADESRAEFVRTETERREKLERNLPYSATDLDRWTGAIGFCDLLSLYLCCGSQQSVELPLAHPANSSSAHARKTVLSWKNGSPQFSPPVLQPATRVSLDVLVMRDRGSALEQLHLAWEFPAG